MLPGHKPMQGCCAAFREVSPRLKALSWGLPPLPPAGAALQATRIPALFCTPPATSRSPPSALLSAFGIETAQLTQSGGGASRAGCRRYAIQQAIDQQLSGAGNQHWKTSSTVKGNIAARGCDGGGQKIAIRTLEMNM